MYLADCETVVDFGDRTRAYLAPRRPDPQAVIWRPSMTTGSAKMTHGGAGGLAAYLMEERLVGYYAEASGRAGQHIRSFGAKDVIFSAEQVQGSGVEAMGIDLSNGLTFGQFQNLCEGKHADTGQQLVAPGHRAVLDPVTGEKIGTEEAHTMAIDTYFSAPKSVSVLAVVAAQHNPELVPKIIAAQEAAVREASGYVEREARLGRRTVATPSEMATAGPRLVTKPGHAREGQASKQQGSKSERVAVDLIVISATQHTARPNDATMAAGRMPDPHLHTHRVFMGPAYDSTADKWVQIDDYGLKSTAVRRDADYLGALARNLQEVGVELDFDCFEDGKNGRQSWRVKGITQEACKFFSTNHERKWDLKRDLEDKLGKAVPEKVIQDAMRLKRRAKDVAAKKQDSAPVYELWQQDADRFEVTLADKALVKRLTEGREAVTLAPYEERRTEFFRRLYGEKGVNKEDAEFDGKVLAEAMARCAEGLSFTVDDRLHLELEVMGELKVQRAAADPARALYTTPAMFAAETNVANALARKAKTRGFAHPSRSQVDQALSGLGVTPDAEQRAAIDAATSGRGLTIINGWAGTGKTTSLRAVVDAGRMIGPNGQPSYDRVVVVSTASLTAQGTGAKLRADDSCSIDGFVYRVDRGRIKPTAATLVIVDEAAMTNTFSQERLLAAVGPAQLIFVGDPEQSQPIGPGGTYQAAVRAHGATELTQVWRQQDHRDRRDFALLRQGKAAEMLDNLDARSRLHISDTASERIDNVLDYYQAYRESGRKVEDVRIITDSSNAAVDECNRHIQRTRRDLGEIPFRGIQVEARSDGRRCTLHNNDLVMFLAPKKCGSVYVANGATGVIVHANTASNRVAVKLDDDRVVKLKLDGSAEQQPLGLAYAVHVAKYQGAEVPIVLGVLGGPGTTNKNSAYSILTRCTEEAHVFADRETHGDDPKKTLQRVLSTAPTKVTASSRRDIDDNLAHVTGEPAQTNQAKDQDGEARRLAGYLRQADRIVGPDEAKRIATAPAYPSLNSRLQSLEREGHDAPAMLASALRQRELTSAEDPAAVLVHRLEGMEPLRRHDASLSVTPLQRRSDDAMAKALNDRAEQAVGERADVGVTRRRGGSDDAMQRALADKDHSRSANKEPARQPERDVDRGLGFEL